MRQKVFAACLKNFMFVLENKLRNEERDSDRTLEKLIQLSPQECIQINPLH